MIRLLLPALLVLASACQIVPPCGNGQVDAPEVCDGQVLNGETCTSRGYGPGTLKCTATCTKFDLTACGAPATCGNGVKDGVELCEGADLAGQTCNSLGLGAGTLRCAANCGGFDTSNCGGSASCGNGKVDPGEVCDGAVLGGATCQSLGNDFGTLRCLNNCSGYDPQSCTKKGTKFADGSKWGIPAAGGDASRSWYDLVGQGSALGSFQWVTVDMDGDGKPDLLSHSRSYAEAPPATGTVRYPHGWPSDSHWLFFQNTGSGFGTGLKWAIPSTGGTLQRGWHDTASYANSGVGEFQWAMLDLNGDGKPDLVSFSRSFQDPPPATSTTSYPHGWPSDSHWLVFLNTGSGFAAGTRWAIPSAGGDVARGWYNLGSGSSDVGDFQWSMLDMDGDKKPDLVSASRSYQDPPPASSTTNYPHGWPNDRHWIVFPNTGSGFGTAVKWTLPPTGGDVARSWYSLANGSSDVGDFQWVTMDLDGDGKPDLVSHSRSYQDPPPASSTTNYPHGWPSDPHWLFFPNTGSGFGTGSKWTLPPVGGSVARGWYGVANGSSALGDFQWATLDLDGDKRPDLVSYSRAFQDPAPATSTTTYPHGWPSDRHWLIFPNTGSGFGTGARWGIPPAGGTVARSWHQLASGSSALGDFQWATLDVNGDGRSDLVSHSRAYQEPAPATGTIDYPHGWPNDRHWLVFLNSP